MHSFSRVSLISWGDNKWTFLIGHDQERIAKYRSYPAPTESSMRRVFKLVLGNEAFRRLKSPSKRYWIYETERVSHEPMINYNVVIRHGDNCLCTYCKLKWKSTPDMQYTWYNTDTLHIYVTEMEYDGKEWFVNYNIDVLHPKAGEPHTFATVGKMRFEMWKDYAARWRENNLVVVPRKLPPITKPRSRPACDC